MVEIITTLNFDPDEMDTVAEVQALYDYMDGRVEDGSEPEEVIAALITVLAQIGQGPKEMDQIH